MDYFFERFTENTNRNSAKNDSFSYFLIFIIYAYIIYAIYKFFIEIQKQRNTNINSENRYNNNTGQNNNEEDDCPICQETLKNTVELDCAHKFCAKCIMDYYKTRTPNLSCPMCRKNIRLINILKYNRSEEMKPYMEMIVIFNHEHLSGYNYVKDIFYFFIFIF